MMDLGLVLLVLLVLLEWKVEIEKVKKLLENLKIIEKLKKHKKTQNTKKLNLFILLPPEKINLKNLIIKLQYFFHIFYSFI